MKVIDILNKMANYEKMPKCIKVSGEIYKYYSSYKDYLKEDSSKWFISDFVDCYSDFNKEVEIIEDTPKEDKKIKKIKSLNNIGHSKDIIELLDKQQINNHILKNKINEIINHLNVEK